MKKTLQKQEDGLFSIDGVEIFSAGTWNGDEYSVADLDQMIVAFENHKDHLAPFIKISHDEKQKLVAEEGLPSLGVAKKLYRLGDKLLADFCDIPSKIATLIEKKAYRKVSCEVYWNVKIKDKEYPYMLGAVALLGAETPGVGNLSDILALYGLKNVCQIKSYADSQTDARIYSFEHTQEQGTQGAKRMDLEQKLAAAEAKAAQLEADKSKYASDLKTATERAEKAEADKAELEKKNFASEQEKKQIALEKDVDQMVAEKLITPAMKPYALALLGDEPKNEKKTYSMKVADKDVEHTKVEIVKELCKLFAKKADVNFEESSSAGATGKQGAEPTVAEVEKYASEKKMNFRAAYAELMKQRAEDKK